MTNVKNWTIKDIESLADAEAWYMANGDYAEIKGHDVYFIDFPGYFGYSCCVFYEGKSIHYANDYELHHPGKTHEELKEYYINALNNKLFTEEEITEPLKDYDDYTRKEYFLRNYYPMREDYVSIFCINPSEEQKAYFKKKTAGMVYDPLSFGYFEDPDFVKHHLELFAQLSKRKEETKDNFEYQKAAFLSEMYNHEYNINWQADYDTLSAFGCLDYMGDDGKALKSYFEQLNFTDLQKKAYFAAREEYYKNANY